MNLKECNYLNADCAILMFDLTKKHTYKNLSEWYDNLIKICEDIPVVVVGNRSEIKEKGLI